MPVHCAGLATRGIRELGFSEKTLQVQLDPPRALQVEVFSVACFSPAGPGLIQQPGNLRKSDDLFGQISSHGQSPLPVAGALRLNLLAHVAGELGVLINVVQCCVNQHTGERSMADIAVTAAARRHLRTAVDSVTACVACQDLTSPPLRWRAIK